MPAGWVPKDRNVMETSADWFVCRYMWNSRKNQLDTLSDRQLEELQELPPIESNMSSSLADPSMAMASAAGRSADGHTKAGATLPGAAIPGLDTPDASRSGDTHDDGDDDNDDDDDEDGDDDGVTRMGSDDAAAAADDDDADADGDVDDDDDDDDDDDGDDAEQPASSSPDQGDDGEAQEGVTTVKVGPDLVLKTWPLPPIPRVPAQANPIQLLSTLPPSRSDAMRFDISYRDGNRTILPRYSTRRAAALVPGLEEMAMKAASANAPASTRVGDEFQATELPAVQPSVPRMECQSPSLPSASELKQAEHAVRIVKTSLNEAPRDPRAPVHVWSGATDADTEAYLKQVKLDVAFFTEGQIIGALHPVENAPRSATVVGFWMGKDDEAHKNAGCLTVTAPVHQRPVSFTSHGPAVAAELLFRGEEVTRRVSLFDLVVPQYQVSVPDDAALELLQQHNMDHTAALEAARAAHAAWLKDGCWKQYIESCDVEPEPCVINLWVPSTLWTSALPVSESVLKPDVEGSLVHRRVLHKSVVAAMRCMHPGWRTFDMLALRRGFTRYGKSFHRIASLMQFCLQNLLPSNRLSVPLKTNISVRELIATFYLIKRQPRAPRVPEPAFMDVGREHVEVPICFAENPAAALSDVATPSASGAGPDGVAALPTPGVDTIGEATPGGDDAGEDDDDARRPRRLRRPANLNSDQPVDESLVRRATEAPAAQSVLALKAGVRTSGSTRLLVCSNPRCSNREGRVLQDTGFRAAISALRTRGRPAWAAAYRSTLWLCFECCPAVPTQLEASIAGLVHAAGVSLMYGQGRGGATVKIVRRHEPSRATSTDALGVPAQRRVSKRRAGFGGSQAGAGVKRARPQPAQAQQSWTAQAPWQQPGAGGPGAPTEAVRQLAPVGVWGYFPMPMAYALSRSANVDVRQLLYLPPDTPAPPAMLPPALTPFPPAGFPAMGAHQGNPGWPSVEALRGRMFPGQHAGIPPTHNMWMQGGMPGAAYGTQQAGWGMPAAAHAMQATANLTPEQCVEAFVHQVRTGMTPAAAEQVIAALRSLPHDPDRYSSVVRVAHTMQSGRASRLMYSLLAKVVGHPYDQTILGMAPAV